MIGSTRPAKGKTQDKKDRVTHRSLRDIARFLSAREFDEKEISGDEKTLKLKCGSPAEKPEDDCCGPDPNWGTTARGIHSLYDDDVCHKFVPYFFSRELSLNKEVQDFLLKTLKEKGREETSLQWAVSSQIATFNRKREEQPFVLSCCGSVADKSLTGVATVDYNKNNGEVSITVGEDAHTVLKEAFKKAKEQAEARTKKRKERKERKENPESPPAAPPRKKIRTEGGKEREKRKENRKSSPADDYGDTIKQQATKPTSKDSSALAPATANDPNSLALEAPQKEITDLPAQAKEMKCSQSSEFQETGISPLTGQGGTLHENSKPSDSKRSIKTITWSVNIIAEQNCPRERHY